MTDVIISVAHGNNSTQAVDGLFNEYTISLMWSTFLHTRLLIKGINVQTINEPLFINKKNIINRINPKLCIEIHFNSFYDGTVRGAETLYDAGSVLGENYAVIMQDHIRCLPNRDRGVKEGWYLSDGKTRLYFLHHTRCPALIIEPGFIAAKELLIEMAPMGVDMIAIAICEILGNEKVLY